MIPLLVIAGISLTASAISWWNGHRTAKVQKEIDVLEDELAQIYAADVGARRLLIAEYVKHLDSFIEQELNTRNAVANELVNGHAKARAILNKPFGSREQDSFRQIFFELELALSRINAERAYLKVLRTSLGDQSEIPSPADLQLPNDFPREGGLIHFEDEKPQHIHGYRLKLEDWSSDLDGRAMLFNVDHEKRVASITTTGAVLLEANLLDGGGTLPAKVFQRDREGILLEYLGASLFLPYRGSQDYGWLTPEANVDVYPEIWTLEDIVRRRNDKPLHVRVHPRIEGSRKYWSPILLAVNEAMLASLVQAYERLPNDANAPWRIHFTDSGQIAFTMGQVTLVTTIDSEHKAFVLEDVLYNKIDPPVSVRVHAEISVFVPGTNDDKVADRSLFNPFVEAIHSELSSQKQMLLQRKTALRLRKMSLIYQDQQEYLQAIGSCGFLPGESKRGGRVVVGTILASEHPVWLDQAVSTSGYTRLRAVGHDCSWDVKRASWVDQSLRICRIELNVPLEATFHEINPFGLSRIELTGEGSQQQILSRALEHAILGKFASAKVHSTLLGLSGDAVENHHLGKVPVERVLNSDEAVVAVWGPPGTGKTTLLVEWLLALFKQERESKWPSVLIVAPTHVAVSKLVKDLLMKAGRLSEEVVRYGSADRIEGTELEPLWHRHLLKGLRKEPNEEERETESWKRWNELMNTREGQESATKWLLGPRRIQAATCVGMARRDYGLWNRSDPFDIAIIDEAGKAFGAELLIPASIARKVVLVGDHNQLPPTVTTDVLDEDIGYRLSLKEIEELLRRNMFHDIFEQLPVSCKGMLTTQYRMHKDIGDIISELFYDGNLKSHRKDGSWTLTSKRLAFVDFTQVSAYRHYKSQSSMSIENRTERAALHAVLWRLQRQTNGVNFSVLIICPYKAQQNAVDQEIKDSNIHFNVKVTTVDAVQGGEADIVILLMTRSDGSVQFLLDRHRLNVALSRARDAVIIFGHLNCLSPNGDGPVARLVKIGLKNETLDLIRLSQNADFKKELAPQVIPSFGKEPHTSR